MLQSLGVAVTLCSDSEVQCNYMSGTTGGREAICEFNKKKTKLIKN